MASAYYTRMESSIWPFEFYAEYFTKMSTLKIGFGRWRLFPIHMCILYSVCLYMHAYRISSHCRTAPATVLLAFAGFLCPTVTVRVSRIFTAFPSNTRAFYCAPSNLNQESICRIGCLRHLAHVRYLKRWFTTEWWKNYLSSSALCRVHHVVYIIHTYNRETP